MRSAIRNYMAMIAFAIVATLVIGAIGVRIDRSQTPDTIDGIAATPLAQSEAPPILIDATSLLQNLDEIDYIFDLGDIRQYEQGHIPGAAHVWWQDAIRLHAETYSEPDHISMLAADADVFGFLNLHVPQDARVVLYDSNNSERATWLLWVMQINGYNHVQVLDGGLAAWIGAGGELSTAGAAVADTSIQATPTFDEALFARIEGVQAGLNDDNAVLIDTRDPEQLVDTINGTIREGRIPGAINIQTAMVMREDGTFRSPEELRGLFASYGITSEKDVVVYSLFAHQSGNVWVALQLAGFDNAHIFLVGYAGWGADDSLPISTEPFPSVPATSPVDQTTMPEGTPTVGPTDLT